MLDVEHRARDLESETRGAGRRDAFARERSHDASRLENTEEHDGDRACARAPRPFDEAWDERGHEDGRGDDGSASPKTAAASAERGRPKRSAKAR
jgi:hypothetical protein